MVGRRKKVKGEEGIERKPVGTLIPTGSTLLNLCLADNAKGGFMTGRMVNLIGDSMSGKTALALTMLAEVVHRKVFNDYELVFDDAEAALGFDLDYLFGEKVAKRVNTDDYISDTVQDFYGNIQKLLDKGKPFIYVLDSFDALSSEEEQEKDKKYQKSPEERTKKESAGDFGMEKPKMASRMFRSICSRLKKTDSFLLIISQTRDNTGWGFSEKTRSGGKALKFYATHELWLSFKKKIKQTVNKQERVIGAEGVCKISKNKVTGKLRDCPIVIYYDYGIDDIATNIDFLIKTETWSKTGTLIDTKGFVTDRMNFKSLVNYVEENRLEDKLIELVDKVWQEIESAHKLNRRRKYD